MISRLKFLCLALVSLWVLGASAHTIDGNDAHFIQENAGAAISVFMYLGAKHMVTGYDHLLYLLGVGVSISLPWLCSYRARY
ncbi:MAG: HupE/UreJ family protein [Pseudohongiellaceae bacterium]|nr:HupE/UreJ family protein [Pseudohongiellaceae bacterium]